MPLLFLSFREVSVSTTQCVSFKAACLLNTLISNISCIYYMVQSPWCTAAVAVVCCFLSSEGASYAWVWLFFTSNLIAVIKKSTSSDSQWVCVGWLERFDWMWNKQGLPQCTAKTIKWSLWGRPSRLWWLRAGHESVFLHLVFVLHLSLSIYIYLSLPP